MKFSVSSRGELFYKQKKKGKASLFYNGPSRNATKQPLTMYSQTPLVEPRLLAGPYSVLQTGVVNELSTWGTAKYTIFQKNRSILCP